MADGASKAIALPPEILEALGDYRDALKETKRELKDLERQAKEAERKGVSVGAAGGKEPSKAEGRVEDWRAVDGPESIANDIEADAAFRSVTRYGLEDRDNPVTREPVAVEQRLAISEVFGDAKHLVILSIQNRVA